MDYCGKAKLLAALAVTLGLGLANTGCKSNAGLYGPNDSANCNTYPPGSTPDGAAPGPKPGTSSYLPNTVQKTDFWVDTPVGQPPVGQLPMAGLGGAGTEVSFGPIPTEINRVSLPPYTVAPPDILYIDAARLVPKPPYRVEPLEVLAIQVTDTLPNQPINATFAVSPEGTVNLGYGYGAVRVQGLTVDQIQAAIRQHLSNVLRNPQVAVTLAQFRGQQQVRGEHLVRPDGTISLGTYGGVYVAGMTLAQVKTAIEKHLREYVINPQVAVDVYAYNSKWYYVVFDGGGYGQQIAKLPITGNETVLDAVANLQGMPPVASMWRVWVARPAAAGHPCDQVLMVDWLAIVKGGSTNTNYQLFPGDRVYVDADSMIKCDLWLAKILAPVERILGITLLGSSAYNTIRYPQGNTGLFVPVP